MFRWSGISEYQSPWNSWGQISLKQTLPTNHERPHHLFVTKDRLQFSFLTTGSDRFKLASPISFIRSHLHFQLQLYFKKMIQTTTPTRFLLRLLLTLGIFLVAVTAQHDDYDRDSAVSAPVVPRFALQQKCSRSMCPTKTPTPGVPCCYTGTTECNYDYVYLWDSSCRSISCRPVTTCECSSSSSRNLKRRTWNCAMQRRQMAAIDCAVTSTTPLAAQNLAPSVGMSCTPPPA